MNQSLARFPYHSPTMRTSCTTCKNILRVLHRGAIVSSTKLKTAEALALELNKSRTTITRHLDILLHSGQLQKSDVIRAERKIEIDGTDFTPTIDHLAMML